jgi:hypothetical protein
MLISHELTKVSIDSLKNISILGKTKKNGKLLLLEDVADIK